MTAFTRSTVLSLDNWHVYTMPDGQFEVVRDVATGELRDSTWADQAEAEARCAELRERFPPEPQGEPE